MKKKLIAVMIMGALACSLVACGSQSSDNIRDEKEDTQKDEDDERDKDDAKEDAAKKDDEAATESDIVISVEGDEWKNVRAAYNNLVMNMKDYVANCEALDQEYTAYDYMYFDYDEDGENEVILYLGYYEENVALRDVVFMDYFEERNEVGIFGICYAELKDSSFFAEYDSKLARYSWKTSPYESYLYIVAARDDSIIFVLEDAYDYVISELEEAGIHPLPLYGDWELLPED